MSCRVGRVTGKFLGFEFKSSIMFCGDVLLSAHVSPMFSTAVPLTYACEGGSIISGLFMDV